MHTVIKQLPGLKILCGLIFLLTSLPLFASQKLELKLEYPSFDGDFYAEGVVSFSPQAVRNADQIALLAADGSEVASKINILDSWGNGSVMKAQIIFPANASRPQKYMLAYGEDVRRQKGFEQTAVLPTVSFYAGGAPRAAENFDLNVGTINVRVDRSPGINYYWHIVPIMFLVWLTWYRARRIEDDA